MTGPEFANYAMEHGCEVLDSGTAPVIRLHNPATGGKWNVPFVKGDIFPHRLQMGCMALNIPLVEVDEEI